MLKVLLTLIYTFFSERVNETIMQILFRWTVKKLQVKIIKKEYYSILETGQWKVKLHVESKVDKEVGEKKVRFKRTDAAQYHLEDKTTQLLNKSVKTVHKAWQLKFRSVGRPWEMHALFAKATDPRCKSWFSSQVLWSLYEERWSLLNWGWGSAMKLWKDTALRCPSLLCLSAPEEFGWSLHPRPPANLHEGPGRRAATRWHESIVSAQGLMT